MSALVMVKMALAMIRFAVSAMPIGHTPGHLLRAISRHDNRGAVAMRSHHVCTQTLGRDYEGVA